MEQGLRRAVLDKLEGLGETAGYARSDRLVSLARTEIRRLTDCWRQLLATHQPDDDGRCPHCSGWLWRKRWPCAVWLAAHQQLIGDGLAHKQRRQPLRNPFRRRKLAAIIPTQLASSPVVMTDPRAGTPSTHTPTGTTTETTTEAQGDLPAPSGQPDQPGQVPITETTAPLAAIPRCDPAPRGPGGIYRASVVERTGRRLPGPRVRAKVTAGMR